MTPSRRLALTTTLLAVGFVSSAPAGRAQVAFSPGVSSFPDGTILSTVPVVSADRRYVRLGMAPQFTGLQGFDAYSVPAAAAGGGPVGIAAGMNGIAGTGNTPGGPGFVPPGFGGTTMTGQGYDPTASAILAGRMGTFAPPSLAAHAFAAEEQRRAASRARHGRKARPRRRAVAKPTPAVSVPDGQ